MKIVQLGPGRWKLYWELGRDPVTGQRRQKTRVVSAKTRADAERAWRKEQVRIDRGEVDPAHRTVGDLLDAWLQTKTPTLRPSTRDSYALMTARFLRPTLGAKRLDQVTPWEIQQAVQQWIQAPRADGRPGPISRRTVAYAVTLLRSACAMAVQWQWIPRNPVTGVVLPPADRPPPRFWEAATAERFLSATVGDLYWIAWALALVTGLRQGEILGLRWQDVDWATGALTIRQIRGNQARPTFGDPKTARARRVVPLDATTLAMLGTHRDRQAALQAKLGRDYADRDLVVATQMGTPVAPRNLVRAFKAAIRQAGVPEIRFHDLRHTHASLLLAQGTNLRVIADRLGHAQVSFTAQTYAHAGLDAQRAAAATMAHRLLGTPNGDPGKSPDS